MDLNQVLETGKFQQALWELWVGRKLDETSSVFLWKFEWEESGSSSQVCFCEICKWECEPWRAWGGSKAREKKRKNNNKQQTTTMQNWERRTMSRIIHGKWEKRKSGKTYWCSSLLRLRVRYYYSSISLECVLPPLLSAQHPLNYSAAAFNSAASASS